VNSQLGPIMLNSNFRYTFYHVDAYLGPDCRHEPQQLELELVCHESVAPQFQLDGHGQRERSGSGRSNRFQKFDDVPPRFGQAIQEQQHPAPDGIQSVLELLLPLHQHHPQQQLHASKQQLPAQRLRLHAAVRVQLQTGQHYCGTR